jgi:hypothetical protein
MGFVKIHTAWIFERGLDAFEHPAGVITLKVFYALALAKGLYQRKRLKEVESFPASLDQLTDLAHVSRTHASDGLGALRELKMIETGDSDWQGAGVGRRTTFHRFSKTEGGFFMLPVEHFKRSNLLRNVRVRNRIGLGALKLYLLLGALRQNGSGISRIGYQAIDENYGVTRDVIKQSIDLLINTGLVDVNRPEERDQTYVYRLTGILSRHARSKHKRAKVKRPKHTRLTR